MKTSRFTIFSAVVLGGFAVSCHPIGPPESGSPRATGRNPGSVVSDASPAAQQPSGTAASAGSIPDATPPAVVEKPTPATASAAASPSAVKPAAPATPPKPSAPANDPIPTAEKAPGKPGYVLSPYTGKLMLVRGVPSGVVVPDQTSPGSGKKFRVP